ncbi:MAG: hypothetical protein J6T88_08800 [Bacteroidales bacterium]|nr:hypothetical protein [Bacteroidales bacterium]
MVKKIKKIAMLLFVAATVLSFNACGEKENENSDSNSNDAWMLADTEWNWNDLESDEVFDVTVEFNGPKLASLRLWDFSTGIMQLSSYMGTFTYSGGNGTLDLRDSDTDAHVTATFKVAGTTMTLTFKGATYTLTKTE